MTHRSAGKHNAAQREDALRGFFCTAGSHTFSDHAKGIGEMFRQTIRRNQGQCLRVMLLIVLTALLVNGVTLLHHVTEGTSTPVCEQHIDAHDECIRDEALTPVGVSTPTETGTTGFPQRNRPVTKLLYASIFHPPQAR